MLYEIKKNIAINTAGENELGKRCALILITARNHEN